MKILWIPHAAWRISQRAHLFCRALSETCEVHVTDWAADFYSWKDYLHPRYPLNFFYRLSREGRITVHGIPRFSPALYVSVLRRWNGAIFSAWVRRIIRQYRIDVVVGTFVVDPPEAPRLVFDLSDDNVAYWSQGGRAGFYAEEIQATENAYLRSADAVVTASSVLTDKVKGRTDCAIYHIPNAVELERFRQTTGDLFRAEWKPRGRIVGMLGNHDKADELNKVLYAAGQLAREDLTFVIAGRGSALPEARKEASRKNLTNVKFYSNVSILHAPEIVSAFDVGLCPYKKTPGADAASPMRLLQYAAAGLPTVCTNLEEVRRMKFPNVVLVKDDPDALTEGIRRSLRLPRIRPPRIKAYDIRRLAAQYASVLKGE